MAESKYRFGSWELDSVTNIDKPVVLVFRNTYTAHHKLHGWGFDSVADADRFLARNAVDRVAIVKGTANMHDDLTYDEWTDALDNALAALPKGGDMALAVAIALDIATTHAGAMRVLFHQTSQHDVVVG